MNKQGFTLVELLAVLVLIILVMMLIVPSLSKLMNSNDKEQYETYEDMMVEHAKTYPDYKKLDYICLSKLEIKPISKNITCDGYVKINDSKLTSFISCKNTNNEEIYTTQDYTEISGCK